MTFLFFNKKLEQFLNQQHYAKFHHQDPPKDTAYKETRCILNKGMNSGKPQKNLYPVAFVVMMMKDSRNGHTGSLTVYGNQLWRNFNWSVIYLSCASRVQKDFDSKVNKR
jgi:hypothetical protein